MARTAVKKTTKKAPARKAVAKKTAAPAKVSTAKKAAAPAKAVKVTATPGATVTQSALLQSVADHLGVSKAEAKAMVEGYADVVKAYVLKGAKVKIGDIGMIQIRRRAARMGRNPATGEAIKIKASKKLAFRQSATMKEQVSRVR